MTFNTSARIGTTIKTGLVINVRQCMNIIMCGTELTPQFLKSENISCLTFNTESCVSNVCVCSSKDLSEDSYCESLLCVCVIMLGLLTVCLGLAKEDGACSGVVRRVRLQSQLCENKKCT